MHLKMHFQPGHDGLCSNSASVERFQQCPMQNCNPKTMHEHAIGHTRCNQNNKQEEMLMNINAQK